MIVGANGCGKTTIIECLKYVCTGTPPPGGDKGKSFVHDPKIAGLPEVKANIKLRFNDRAGTEMVVVRSLQLTQKKTLSTFKTLDGVIKSTDADGNRRSMSHKCGELDKQVPFLMGVSKAIMDNVIFCHQEESSWPLGDPASLKKKFDDIFESSRYSKALESIRKTKLDYNNKAKEMKVDLASLDAYRDQADVIQRDIDKSNKNLGGYAKKDQAFVDELALVEKELQAHQLHSKKIRDKKEALEKKKAELSLLQARLSDKTATTQILDDSEAEIQTRLEAMKSEEAEAAGGLAELDRRKNKLSAKRSDCQGKLNNLNVKIGSLKSEEVRESMELNGLEKLGSELTKTYKLQSGLNKRSDPNFMESVTIVGESLTSKEDEIQVSLIEAESKYESEVKVLRDKISEIQSEIIQLEGKHQHDDEEYKKCNSEFQEISLRLQQLSSQRAKSREMGKHKDIREKAKKELEECRSDPKLKTLEIEIKELDVNYKAASNLVMELRERIDVVGGRAAEEAKMTEMIDSIDDKILSVQSRADQYRSQIMEYLGSSLKTDDLEVMRQQCGTMKNKLSEAQEQFNDCSARKSTKEKTVVQVETRLDQAKFNADQSLEELNTSRGDVAAQLAQLTKEANEVKQKDANVDNTGTIGNAHEEVDYADGTYDSLVDLIEKEKNDAQVDLNCAVGEKSYLRNMIAKTEKKIQKNKPVSCPCCRQSMDEAVYHAFLDRLQQAIDQDIHGDELFKEWSILEDKARTLKLKIESISDLESKHAGFASECIDLEDELKTLRKQFSVIEKEQTECEERLSATKTIDDQVAKICFELSELDQSKVEWVEKQHRFESSINPLSFSSDLPSKLSEVTKMLQEKEEERDRCAEKSQDKKEEREKLNKKKEHADMTFHAAREEFDRCEQIVKNFQDLEEKKKSLDSRMDELNASKSSLKTAMGPKKTQLAEVKGNCDRVTTLWKKEETKLREEHSKILKDVHEYHRLQQVANSFAVKQTTKHRAEAEEEVEKTNDYISKYTKQLQETEVKLTEIEHDQAEKELMVTKLEANLTIIKLKQNIEECKSDLAQVEDAIKAMASTGLVDFKHTYQECEDNKQIILQSRAENKGKIGAMQRQLHELEGRLKEPNYRGIKERTRKKRVELETTNMAVEDLERYWGALDKALLRFHGQKISDINRIIRELWQRTYCGEDIDGIEIVSGEEGGSTRAARSYNYRVVMRKGNTALDMRGRCSAGQRVLACLVIRLALAETFCVSCGILTLDEPTTNLDEYNKSGLAASLADIISTRSKQRNFQLIVITHDGDFVNHMRDAFNTLGADRCFDLPEHYWRICRNQTGANGQYCSEIHRTQWDDM